jgi:hypothetical protein
MEIQFLAHMLLGFLNPVTAYRVKQYTSGLSHIHITAKLQVMTNNPDIHVYLFQKANRKSHGKKLIQNCSK